MKQEYGITSASSHVVLVKLVNQAIDQGWIPYGYPFYVAEKAEFYQPIMRVT